MNHQSPLSASTIAQASLRLSEPRLHNGSAFWLEGRPLEKGRTTLVEMNLEGEVRDRVRSPLSVRSRVNEYGGGAYCVADSALFFVNDVDQQIYRLTGDSEPINFSQLPDLRFGDLNYCSASQTLYAVAERSVNPKEQWIYAFTSTGEGCPVNSSHDFVSSPCPSPDGRKLAFIRWQNGFMPWDRAQLCYLTRQHDGTWGTATAISPLDSAAMQPQWRNDNELFFICEAAGFLNLFQWTESAGATNLCPTAAEFALPPWNLGAQNYGFVGNNLVLCSYCESGRWRLGEWNLDTHTLRELPRLPFTEISHISCEGNRALLLASSPTMARAIVNFGCVSRNWQVLQGSSSVELFEETLSRAQPFFFPGFANESTHANYYAPAGFSSSAPAPLLIRCHGGPTAAVTSGLDLEVQFWTQHGFALIDVNYAGSSGFGRAYRERLRGNWGVADAADCIAAAEFAITKKWTKSGAIGIVGASAGGFTVLSALCTVSPFTAGSIRYGISDLHQLAKTMHHFEARYDDFLLAPPGPLLEQLRTERSPCAHPERIKAPVIFFQGANDPVVPPAQSQNLYQTLKSRGLAAEWVLFTGEGHGFRRAESIQTRLEKELAFFSQHIKP